jgi:hypothetical protein
MPLISKRLKILEDVETEKRTEPTNCEWMTDGIWAIKGHLGTRIMYINLVSLRSRNPIRS